MSPIFTVKPAEKKLSTLQVACKYKTSFSKAENNRSTMMWGKVTPNQDQPS